MDTWRRSREKALSKSRYSRKAAVFSLSSLKIKHSPSASVVISYMISCLWQGCAHCCTVPGCSVMGAVPPQPLCLLPHCPLLSHPRAHYPSSSLGRWRKAPSRQWASGQPALGVLKRSLCEGKEHTVKGGMSAGGCAGGHTCHRGTHTCRATHPQTQPFIPHTLCPHVSPAQSRDGEVVPVGTGTGAQLLNH